MRIGQIRDGGGRRRKKFQVFSSAVPLVLPRVGVMIFAAFLMAAILWLLDASSTMVRLPFPIPKRQSSILGSGCI